MQLPQGLRGSGGAWTYTKSSEQDQSSLIMAANLKLNPIGVLIAIICGVIVLYAFGLPTWFQSEPKVNMKQLLSVAIDLAKRGGDAVKSIRVANNLHEVQKGETREGAKELLTEGDLKSHLAMVYGFAKAFPGLKVISEEHETKPIDFQSIHDPDKNLLQLESVDGSYEVPIGDIAVWIDPLDATQEYTENLVQYVTTMVCVAVKGEPTIGVIHKPFEAKTFWGFSGHGHSDSLQVVKSDAPTPADDKKRIIVSRSHSGKVEEVVNAAIGKDKATVIPAGGAGYKTLEVIEGRADAYVHVTLIKKWDLCAGNAIIRSVEGGHMTTLGGSNVDYSAADSPLNEDGILATMKGHDEYLKLFKPAYEAMKKEQEEKAKSQ